MTICDVKRSLLENMNVWKQSEMMKNNLDLIDINWSTFTHY